MARWQSMDEYYRGLRQEFLDNCVSCGICVEVCPIYSLADWGGLPPEVLHEQRMSVLRDRLVSDEAYRFTFACSNCAACKGSCPDQLDTFALTQLMRWAVREAGYEAPDGLRGSHNRPDSRTKVCAAIQTKPPDVRWLTAAPENPPQADEVIFLGCSILAMPDKVNALLDITRLLYRELPVLSGTELCCGSQEIIRGDAVSADRQMRNLVAELARFRPRTVICLCSGCYGKLGGVVPHFLDLPFQVQHVSSFLLEHVRGASMRPLQKTVTVYDSCGMGRIADDYETVRQLLSEIPGIELVEMAKNRATAPCCGALTQAMLPEVASELLSLGLQEAKATGAGTVATVCQGCQRRFAREERDYPFTVESFITLLGEALGISYEDKLKRYTGYRDPERVIGETADYIAASGYPQGELETYIRRHFR